VSRRLLVGAGRQIPDLTACLFGRVTERKPMAQLDDIEQIAMLSCCRIGPFAGDALARVRPGETDEQRAAGRVVDVTDQPVIA
jgi:hypothetical protein